MSVWFVVLRCVMFVQCFVRCSVQHTVFMTYGCVLCMYVCLHRDQRKYLSSIMLHSSEELHNWDQYNIDNLVQDTYDSNLMDILQHNTTEVHIYTILLVSELYCNKMTLKNIYCSILLTSIFISDMIHSVVCVFIVYDVVIVFMYCVVMRA